MAVIVVYAGGFQPFHQGHLSSYIQAKEAFPNADFYVAASADVKQRPIPYEVKKFLAVQAGVQPKDFPNIVVASPLSPKEILSKYNPDQDIFILVRSERDPVGYTKKDGSPGYYQPFVKGKKVEPFAKHGYVFVTKKHDFVINGQEVYSGTQVRDMYKNADDAGRQQIIAQLYPKSKQQPKIKEYLDQYIGSEITPPKEEPKLRKTAMKKLQSNPLKESLRDLIKTTRPLLKEANAEQKLKLLRLIREAFNKVNEQGVAEGGMPSSVIKSKQRYSDMSDKDFAELHQSKADDDLVAMAWRHGYGKGNLHYVNKRKRGKEGVAEARIETIHGSAYTIDPNKYYVWAWDNAVVLYGEYTDENDAELNLSKIERRATKRLGPAVKGRFEVASGKMLLRQYGNEQGVAEARHVKLQKMRELCESLEISGSEKTAILDRVAQKIKNIFDKGVYVAKQEGRELGSAVKTVASWKTSTPQQKQKAKDDLSDLGQFVLSAATSAFASKVVLGALISNAVADPAVAAVAGPVSDLAKHAVEHIISELGITGIASAAGAMGLVYIKKMLHDASSTSSGQRWDRMQTLKQRPDYKPMAGPKPGVLPEQQNSTVAEDYLDEK